MQLFNCLSNVPVLVRIQAGEVEISEQNNQIEFSAAYMEVYSSSLLVPVNPGEPPQNPALITEGSVWGPRQALSIGEVTACHKGTGPVALSVYPLGLGLKKIFPRFMKCLFSQLTVDSMHAMSFSTEGITKQGCRVRRDGWCLWDTTLNKMANFFSAWTAYNS